MDDIEQSPRLKILQRSVDVSDFPLGTSLPVRTQRLDAGSMASSIVAWTSVRDVFSEGCRPFSVGPFDGLSVVSVAASDVGSTISFVRLPVDEV